MAKIRSAAEIGDLWPLCNKCRHIAQSHDSNGCDANVFGKCPTCGGYEQKVQCSCKAYQGPTIEEFERIYMTPEEVAYYGFSRGRLEIAQIINERLG